MSPFFPGLSVSVIKRLKLDDAINFSWSLMLCVIIVHVTRFCWNNLRKMIGWSRNFHVVRVRLFNGRSILSCRAEERDRFN